MERKTALVTGSNRGIGLAVVKALLDHEYNVILTSRNEEEGREAVSTLGRAENLYYHQLDVTDTQSVSSLFDFVDADFGRLDVLVNNAGGNYDSGQHAEYVALQTVRDTIETNLLGAWQMCQVFIPLMKKHGYGRIVNVSSGAGSFAEMGGNTPAYSVSKAAMNVLTVKLAHDLSGMDILVNSVCPGWVKTRMGGSSAPRSVEKGAETIVWAATLPANGPSGKFFRDKKEIAF